MKQTSQQTLSTFAISIIANKFTSLESYALKSFFFFLTKFGFKDNDQNKFDGLILGHMTISKKKLFACKDKREMECANYETWTTYIHETVHWANGQSHA